MIDLHPCQVADAPRLAALARRLFRDTYAPTHPAPQLSGYIARQLSTAAVARELAQTDTAVWIATAGVAPPIGYLWLRAAPPPAGSAVPGERPWHLRRVFVVPEWQGRGVAHQLVATPVAEAARRGGDALWLAVWQQAARPIAFYRKAGFAVVGTSTFPMGRHRDEDFVMARKVP
jgi:ribosomal protein S18 acetylase RimI-like enzyme